MKKVFIVVVHFGEIAVTKACFASLEKHETYPYHLIVVNNTKDLLSSKDFAQKRITIIHNNGNKGFAGGVNPGIEKALLEKADAVLLLNNDTKIEKPFLRQLVDLLFSKKEIGIVGPAIAFVKGRRKVFDLGGYITWFGKTFHKEVVSTKYCAPREVTYMTGAAMLVKREVFEKNGFFDEQYFLYYEDVDFCLRAKEKGFLTFNTPLVSISHLLSKSAGKVSPFAVYHQTRSAVIFGQKNIKEFSRKFIHGVFLILQSIQISIKHPKAGIAAWKALFSESAAMYTIGFLFLIVFFVWTSYWRVFSFTFWKDDWSLLWSTLYNLKGYHGYFNHPGTPIEFFLLTPLFGLRSVLWMEFGVLLRITNAFFVGLLSEKITRSKKIGILAGIFFAGSYAGSESIHFISAQVTALALIPLCITGIYFIKFLEEKKIYIYYFLFWLLITFVVDPPRTVPIIFILPFFISLHQQARNYLFARHILKTFYVTFAFLGIPLFILWFIFLSPGTLLAKLIAQLPHHPEIFFLKWYEVNHFFATIGNLFIGWISRMGQDVQNTGIYARQFAIYGYVFAGIAVGSIIAFLKTKRKPLGIIALSVFWAFFFYLPNFLSEPRAPMAAPHRYLLIPSIGMVLLAAYCIARLNNKLLVVICSVIFILCNIYQSNTILAYQATYRSKIIVESIWNQLATAIPKSQEYDSIWMVHGEEPWVSQDILLSGSAPLGLMRKLTNSDRFPMMTNDPNIVLQFLCHDNLPQINRWNIVLQKKRIRLSHIYAWAVGVNGKITDESQKARVIMKAFAEEQHCIPLE